MKASGHLFPLLVAVCSVLLFGCASYEVVEVVETEEQATENSLFGQYLHSSLFLDPLAEFLIDYVKRQDKDLGSKSPGQHKFTGTKAFIEEPVKFAAGAKHPVAGVWHVQAYDVAATATRAYNVWCFAVKGKAPELADGVMGNTICNLELQFDVIPTLFVAAHLKYLSTGTQSSPDQTPIITDTRVTDLAKLDVLKGQGSWTEEWTLVLGEKTIAIKIEFTRFADRTDFHIGVPGP